MIAGVDVTGERCFVLSNQEGCNFTCHSSQCLIIRINQPPFTGYCFAVGVLCSEAKCIHNVYFFRMELRGGKSKGRLERNKQFETLISQASLQNADDE